VRISTSPSRTCGIGCDVKLQRVAEIISLRPCDQLPAAILGCIVPPLHVLGSRPRATTMLSNTGTAFNYYSLGSRRHLRVRDPGDAIQYLRSRDRVT